MPRAHLANIQAQLTNTETRLGQAKQALDVETGRYDNARLTLAVTQIEAAVQDLHEKGVAISEVRAVSNGRLASLKDPDGNELLLWQYA